MHGVVQKFAHSKAYVNIHINIGQKYVRIFNDILKQDIFLYRMIQPLSSDKLLSHNCSFGQNHSGN